MIDAKLDARNTTYGAFENNSRISQELKRVLFGRIAERCRDTYLSDVQREGLEMICHKLSRIVNGDFSYADNWEDIAGYAQLVAKDIESHIVKNSAQHKRDTPTIQEPIQHKRDTPTIQEPIQHKHFQDALDANIKAMYRKVQDENFAN